MKLPKTEAVVGVTALLGLVVYCWVFLPWPWAIVATLAALWEAVALVTGLATISGVIWSASDKYSLVPWAGGFALGLGVASGYVSAPEVIVPLALLSGHFWFPRYDDVARQRLTGKSSAAHKAERAGVDLDLAVSTALKLRAMFEAERDALAHVNRHPVQTPVSDQLYRKKADAANGGVYYAQFLRDFARDTRSADR